MSADFITTTNMSLTVPIPGTTVGPDWANEINASLILVDAHDHTSGKGVSITPGALDLNSDVSFLSNNATFLRTVRFSAPIVQPALSTDLNCIYAVGLDLYIRDGSGNQVRITQSGGVAGTPGSITNLASPASVTYVGGSTSYVFQSDANKSAFIDASSIIIRNLSTASKGLTLAAPAAMAADFTVTLPTLPAATSVVTMTSGGAMGTTTPDGSTIVNSGGLLKVPAGGITATQIASGAGLVLSGMMVPYGGTSAPSGYLLCDGTSYLRGDYPDLFTAIGTAYGTADGTHFNVPDLRGYFLRGVSGSTSNDPDKASRTAMNTGGNTGNNVGSVQANAFTAHTHNISACVQSGTNGSNIMGGSLSTLQATVATASSGGSTETRPLNAYVNYLIKI